MSHPPWNANLHRRRPEDEEAAYQRLEAQVRPVPMAVCDGCTRCATRCTDGIDLSFPEFARLLDYLQRLPSATVERVLRQQKQLPWGEEATVAMCPFLDMESQRCLVYPARPLICRLFGFAPWLPCPGGREIPPVPEALALFQAYADLERRPLRQWLWRTGIELPGIDP